MKNIILAVVTAGLLMGAKTLIGEKKGGEAIRKPAEVAPQEPCSPAPPPEQPGMSATGGFGRWLDELTKAYQENDRAKMGQLIEKMHQFRQNRPAFSWGRTAPAGPPPSGAGWRPDMEEGWPGRFRGPQERWRGFQPRGMGRPQPPMPLPEGMEGPPPVMPDEYMDRPGPDLPLPTGIKGPRPPLPPEEMGPPMKWGRRFRGRGRGMGPPPAWERPFPGPWCPWWRHEEMD